MRVDPRRYIVGYWNFQEPRGGLGADFSDHLLFFAKVIDYIVANYVRADAESGARDTMSYYGRRLVEFGLLGEHFDERTETWTIDTDGELSTRREGGRDADSPPPPRRTPASAHGAVEGL